MSKYYLTTPIYYVNATPHIGHAYTTIVADTIKRFRRMMGDEAYLTTGTDEHGQKVEKSAAAAGLTPREFTDRVSEAFRAEWNELGLEYDFYRRTTDPRHAKAVRAIFSRCLANGAIYKDSYTGKYHIGDEAFVTDEEAEQADPAMITTVTEENYFFKLSAYRDKLIELYESQPDFVQPDSRRNEVLSFVRGGLKDLSISRSTLQWGIPLPNDPAHVFYVWFDALSTYMSAVGYGEEGEARKRWEKLWPVDVHLVGKEIVRFHAVYWPAFLMAAELPLPKQVWAHGLLIFQGGKMSKSKGNIVRARPIDKVVGIEGLRYYLLREIVFGQDGNFSFEALVGRYNSDLANGVGNLAGRTAAMIAKFHGGLVPAAGAGGDGGLQALAAETIEKAAARYAKFEFSRALEAIWALFAAVDKYIVANKPWALAKAKDESSQAQLAATLYNSTAALRIGAALAHPVLPQASQKIWAMLGETVPLRDFRLADLAWGGLKPDVKLAGQDAIFPRLDVEKSVKRMEELEQEALKEQAAIFGKPAADEPAAITIDAPEVAFDDFVKIDMRVGLVKAAEKVAKSKKLLALTVDIGEAEPRSIVAGIAGAYAPEELVGRKVAIVANLKPRKMMGRMSQGMVVAASIDHGHPYLVSFLEDAPIGARLS